MIHAEMRVALGAARDFEPASPAGGLLLLTDAHVEPLLPARLADLPRHVIAPGEASKSWAELERLLLALDAQGVDRSGELLCVGGGVVSDLGGMAALLHRRGIAWTALPTSLVAQADAALGGKTAVNLGGGKNTVGGFHPARAVIVDPSFLASLPQAELRAGFAEVVKTALLSGQQLLAAVEALSPAEVAEASPAFCHVLEQVVATKLGLVEGDLHDRGARRLLNLGHTFGHAFEALQLGELRHGEAVGLGLLCAARLGGDAGLESRLRVLLERWKLPTRLAADRAAVTAQMRRDKKRQDGALTLILIAAPGRAQILEGAEAALVDRGLDAVLGG